VERWFTSWERRDGLGSAIGGLGTGAPGPERGHALSAPRIHAIQRRRVASHGCQSIIPAPRSQANYALGRPGGWICRDGNGPVLRCGLGGIAG
jgi:hypothetical protein